MNSISGEGEEESISQFFHILNSVNQQRGCCNVGDGKYEIQFIHHVAISIKKFIIIQVMVIIKIID